MEVTDHPNCAGVDRAKTAVLSADTSACIIAGSSSLFMACASSIDIDAHRLMRIDMADSPSTMSGDAWLLSSSDIGTTRSVALVGAVRSTFSSSERLTRPLPAQKFNSFDPFVPGKPSSPSSSTSLAYAGASVRSKRLSARIVDRSKPPVP